MGVYKEIAKADGSGITTFYRLSEEKSTVETTSTGTAETMFDYNNTLNKPSINDVALVGNKTLDELGIQPAGDYITEIPAEYITEEELEAKDYATEAFVIEQINNAEHFHREIVDALPLTGKDNILYLVPKKGSDKDIYNEYIWTGTDYEFMGTTAVDLSDYYKKGEVDTLLDNKVTKVNGKQLSTNDYTTAEKTKLASLENYDDSELRSKVDSLHNYDDTAIKLDIQELKKDTSTNEIDITSIENELGYKAEIIRLVKNGDWWLCQDAKGNNLTLEMAMNRLGLPKTILLLENLENDGKYYPVEYELQEKYIDIIYKDLDGITHHLNYGYNEYFTNTASGDYIHLENSINYPYKELSVDGVCEQATTSGKNLAEITDVTKTIGNDLNYTAQNGEIKLNGTLSSNSNLPIGTLHLEANTDYYFSINKSASLNGSYLIIDNNGTFIYFGVDKTFQVSQTKDYELSLIAIKGTYNNLILKPQSELGTTKTSWEPYTGGQPSPSPDYPQEIKTIGNSLKITSCNKNFAYLKDGTYTKENDTAIINNNLITLNTSSSTGSNSYFSFGNGYTQTWAPAGDGIKNVNDLKLTGDGGNYIATIYTNKTISGIISFRIYTSNNRELMTTISSYMTSTINISLEDGEHIKDYGIWSGSSLIFNDYQMRVQLEKGTTATPYEQHLETQIEANLPENEFIGKIDDTYKDTLKVEYNETDGQYHLNLYKNVGKIVLNDYTNISIYSFNNMNGVQFKNVLNENYDCANGISNRSNLVGKRYIQNTIWVGVNSINVFWLGILDLLNITTIDEFKTWLSTHNTEVYYALKTPYVVDLGVVDMPITYNEVTNLFTDSDLMPTMNIEYYTAILENAKDTIIGQDIYLQNEVDNVSSLPADANKGDIRRTKDTKDWYIYDGIEWSAFDKASEVDLSNYLAKDNTVAYKPATDYNPSTKKYVDDSIADIFIPTKTSQLTNDSGFVLKSANDLTNYYNKSNTYNKAEVNALVAGGGGSSVDITLNGVSTTSPSFYAPINGGTSGQVLTSNGSSAPTWGALSTVATSGSYNDLSDKPAIPTKTSQLTNDSNYTTLWSVENSFDDGTAICGWSSTATDGQDMTADYGMTPAMAAGIQAGKKYTWDSRVSFSGTNNAVCYYASNDFGTADDGTRYNYVSAKIGSNTDWISFCWDDTTVYYGSTWPGSSGGKACFAGDTLVWTPDGEKKIKDIQIGDKVMSINIERDRIEPREITKLVNHEEEEILVITTEDDIIEATGSHPFYEKSKGKVNARILEVGDELMDDKFGLHKITKIEKKEFNDTVYEIVVDYTHNYFVGKNHIRVFNEPSVLKD